MLLFCGICYAQDSFTFSTPYNSDDINFFITDSIHTPKSDSTIVQEKSDGHILGQILLAPIVGIGFSIPIGYISYKIFSSQHEMGGLISIPFFYLGYILGSSVSVFVIGEANNPNTSFWATFGAGLAGAGAGIGIVAADGDKRWETPDLIAILGMPILFEILYANLLVPDEQEQMVFNKPDELSVDKSISYKDIYNSTMLYKMEILRINF